MKKIGLSLSGGSFKGAAHIGVLKEINKHKIEITHLAGTSAGAVIAGLYAAGISPEKIEQKLDELSVRQLLDLRMGRQGLIKGERIYELFLEMTEGKYFSDLKIPLAVTCVDLVSGRLKIIRSGEVAEALRASIAIPGIFTPVEIENEILVDGYVLNNNPADIVKKMGAEYVVAVQTRQLHEEYPHHLLSQLKRYLGIASYYLTIERVEEAADLIIDVDLSHLGGLSWNKIQQIIKEGEREAEIVLGNEQPGYDIQEKSSLIQLDFIKKLFEFKKVFR